MAEVAASTSTPSVSYQEDDFYCPVCQEVLQTPVRIQYCEHVFCRKCFLMAMKSAGAHCPLCRGHVCRWERSAPERASDIESVMRRISGGCRYCEKQVKFCHMRLHYNFCRKYQDEYGVLPNDPTEQTRPNSANRLEPTFKCPLCLEENLNRKGLLDHCNKNHYFQIVETVCPICATLPLGNHNPITGNVVDHLNARHQFDYGEFMNCYLDDEAQYQAAIEESSQTPL